MSIDTHEEFPAVPTKTVLTVMGDHLNGSPVHYLIDAPKFHYDGVHAVGPKFYEDMFINIGKKGMMKRIMNSTIHFIMIKGL